MTAFHRRSTVAGGLALVRAFCQWCIEHTVRKCRVKSLVRRNMDGRERDADRVYVNGYTKRMKKKEEKIRNSLNLQKKIGELFACDIQVQ